MTEASNVSILNIVFIENYFSSRSYFFIAKTLKTIMSQIKPVASGIKELIY